MHFTATFCILAGALFANAQNNIPATTITDSNGNTIINYGITSESSMTMTTAPSTSGTSSDACDSLAAIIIDGTTTCESGSVSAGPGETSNVFGDGGSTAGAQTTGTDTSTGWGSKITQAPMLAGGVAALALLAV